MIHIYSSTCADLFSDDLVYICLDEAMISCKDSLLHDGDKNRTQFLAVIKTIPTADCWKATTSGGQ